MHVTGNVHSVFAMITHFLDPFPKMKTELDTFREDKLSMLQETIATQRANKEYQRRSFVDIASNDLNPPTLLVHIPAGIDHHSSNVKFFPFNAEGIRDYGWGCAWRSIQTCLAAAGVDLPLESLFHLFGKESHLKFLYSDKYSEGPLHHDKPFAPYELSSGWAEPFIGEMAFHFFGKKAVLECVNGIPDSCNAPAAVFHNAPISFPLFKERLIAHFKEENALPVMMDDGSYAFCIIGIGTKEDKTRLWIADPHIKPGANAAAGPNRTCGVFTMAFDADGAIDECSLDGNDSWQRGLFTPEDYSHIAFNKINWMALFPTV